MSVAQAPFIWRALQPADTHAVVDMEREACMHPLHAWSVANYDSCLRSGYWAQVACDVNGHPCGVCVAMPGVDEAHLLNIAVALHAQGQGLARWMLSQLDQLCLANAWPTVWLEVRPSNARALALYASLGYAHVGTRKAYYPAVAGREDAWVMKRQVHGTVAQEVAHVAVD